MSDNMEEFINSLPFRKESKGETKLASAMSHLPEEVLYEILGYEKTSTAFGCSMKESYHGECDTEFLSQFEGTPLYANAVALAEQELEAKKQQLQKRMERQRDESFEQEMQQRDMLDIQKQQLLLELHKHKASMTATQPSTAAAPTQTPAQQPPPSAAPSPGGVQETKKESSLFKKANRVTMITRAIPAMAARQAAAKSVKGRAALEGGKLLRGAKGALGGHGGKTLAAGAGGLGVVAGAAGASAKKD